MTGRLLAPSGRLWAPRAPAAAAAPAAAGLDWVSMLDQVAAAEGDFYNSEYQTLLDPSKELIPAYAVQDGFGWIRGAWGWNSSESAWTGITLPVACRPESPRYVHVPGNAATDAYGGDGGYSWSTDMMGGYYNSLAILFYDGANSENTGLLIDTDGKVYAVGHTHSYGACATHGAFFLLADPDGDWDTITLDGGVTSARTPSVIVQGAAALLHGEVTKSVAFTGIGTYDSIVLGTLPVAARPDDRRTMVCRVMDDAQGVPPTAIAPANLFSKLEIATDGTLTAWVQRIGAATVTVRISLDGLLYRTAV